MSQGPSPTKVPGATTKNAAELTAAVVVRTYAICPDCGAAERHRLQAKVFDAILPPFLPQTKAALHVAPEPFFTDLLRRQFAVYKTTDLTHSTVDIKADLCRLPLDDGSFDFVFASHVLEHIPDDRAAIREIHRILKPNGMAVLPVPIVCHNTVEYPGPIETEAGHVRGPGPDYFDRYREVFADVRVYTSEDFGGDSQLYIFEDRSNTPNPRTPYRTPMLGARHLEYVPVCIKGGG